MDFSCTFENALNIYYKLHDFYTLAAQIFNDETLRLGIWTFDHFKAPVQTNTNVQNVQLSPPKEAWINMLSPRLVDCQASFMSYHEQCYGELCGLLGGVTLLAVWRQSGEPNPFCQESNKYTLWKKLE